MKEKKIPFTALVLFVSIVIVLLMMIIVGSQSYTNAVQAQSNNQTVRSSLSYLSARIKAQDASDAVSVIQGPESDCLVLKDITDTAVYEERIYLYQGNLVSEYVKEDAGFNGKNASVLSSVSSFTVVIKDNTVTCTTEKGSITVSLHSEGDLS